MILTPVRVSCSVASYLIDELRDADDVTLTVEDGQAEHRLRDEAVAVLEVLAEPRADVAQVQNLERKEESLCCLNPGVLRGTAQWIKHSPATQATGIRTWIRPKIFSAPILWGRPPHALSLSLSHMPVVSCSSGK